MKKFLCAVFIAATLGMTVFGARAEAQTFSGSGPVWCTDKRCWLQARDAAYWACRKSGCGDCTISIAAWDQCVFDRTNPNAPYYLCTSTCKDKPKCSSAPTVSLSVSPKTIWPPNGKTVNVTLSGTVSVPQGCNLDGASFSLVDSEGKFTQNGHVTVLKSGDFSVSVPVQASRDGKNPNGRSYAVTVTAGDEAGSGSAADASSVPHDQRKK